MANQDQAPSSTASQSNAHRELSPMEDPRSPFFLHHGESPSAILVTQLLTEDNYPNWARAMLMTLDAKSKLCFVDGSVTISMAVTPLEKIAWSKNKLHDFLMDFEFRFTSHHCKCDLQKHCNGGLEFTQKLFFSS